MDKPPTPEMDHEQFVRLLLQHDRTIRAYLRSLLSNANDVDEVMQDVSVVAWRKFENSVSPEHFPRWVCVIARYEVLMFRRKKARDRLVLSDAVEELIANEGLDELETRARQLSTLKTCLGKLPEAKRAIVLQAYSPDANIRSVAERVGMTPEALYKMLSRVRRTLLDCIERRLLEGDVT